MHHFPLPQELDGVPHVGVVGKAENVVVGHPGFLFRAQVLMEVGNSVAGDGDGGGIKGHPRGCHRVHRCGVVHEVVVKPGSLNLFRGHPSGELVDDGAHHFQMPQFFCPYRRVTKAQKGLPRNAAVPSFRKNRGITCWCATPSCGSLPDPGRTRQYTACAPPACRSSAGSDENPCCPAEADG